MSDLFDEIGGSETQPGAVEERMKNGPLIRPGLHCAVLIGAKQTTSKQKGTESWELQFQIRGGAYDGHTHSENLWKTEKTRDRMLLFMHRLGLIKKSSDGKAWEKVEGKRDFLDVLDTPCVIEIQHEEYERDDKSKGKSAKLTFEGVKNPHDKTVVEGLAKFGLKFGDGSSGNGSSGSTSPNQGGGGNSTATTSAEEERKKKLRNL